MTYEEQIRNCAHQLIDRMDTVRLSALLDLFEEELFTPEEIAEIEEMRNPEDDIPWRSVRDDV